MRYEIKYAIENVNHYAIKAYLMAHPASFTTAYPDRQVNNIYMDTPEFKCFHENVEGHPFRKKMRLRWYGDSHLPTYNSVLEEKVKERTAELQQRNLELQRTVTVLRATRHRLVTAEKLAALGELTAGVAHEINNPTQVMLGNLDVLLAELGDRLDPVRPEIELIIEQVYRIQAIIEKLLKYARPGEYAGYLTSVDATQVVQDTVALIRHLQRHHNFELHLQLQATNPITINEQELQQVLVNLISNAVHALPEQGGAITLTASDWEDRGVCIMVADNGAGMDEDQCSQIFNPFYSTKREGEGTGLGLSVSYGLIRRFGGDITVESQKGLGSRFILWLRTEPEIIEDAEALAEQLHACEKPDSAFVAPQSSNDRAGDQKSLPDADSGGKPT